MALQLTKVGVLRGADSPNYLHGAYKVDVAVIGGTEYAFVAANYQSSLTVVDVSTPGSPSYAGRLAGVGSPNYLQSVHSSVYYPIGGVELVFATGYADDSMVIIDVSTPGTPTLEGEIHEAGKRKYLDAPADVALIQIGVEQWAFVVSHDDNALTTIDVTDPTSPSQDDELIGAGSPNYLSGAASVDVYIINGTEYAFATAVNDNSLVIIDVSDPTNISKVADIRGAGSPNYLSGPYCVKVTTIGGTEYAVVACAQEAALTIFDVSTPGSPVHVGQITGAGDPNYLSGACWIDIFTHNSSTYAAVVSWVDNSLGIFDISTPASPTLIDSVQGTGSPNYLDTCRGVKVYTINSTLYAFVAARLDHALTVWEIAEESSSSSSSSS